MADLESLTYEELRAEVVRIGEKAYRADQIFGWVHQKLAGSYAEMKNVPAALRAKLEQQYPMAAPKLRTLQVSKTDGTRKYLFEYRDGSLVESVWMSYHHGYTVCVSSQVGCRMGCTFCASTIGGLVRNLSAGEMLSEVYEIQRDTGTRVSNVVVMGTGEPLDNYTGLVQFLRLLTGERGLHISERNITVSTCGIVPGIKKLAKEGLAVNLALSLHAPDDELRRSIMPVARSFSLEEILPAMRMYYESNHRRITFEYALIRGVNDTDSCVEKLVRLLKGMNCLVNLIPVNPVTETHYRETTAEGTRAFKKKLENQGVHVTIRREMGRDIDGACGQLRRRTISKE